ncbi:WecB/TagA/CpsF family glycosyltransferase [Patescibacteria group bacterium]|nr:WecB/TagA/CpsF family glycosyltransferase [Patescibacteria group bacterium]MBU1028619.1 WecB/TagA/CpsF family glycosyltransferase [Patescibacteria group bacterium]
MKVTILGVQIDSVTTEKALKAVADFLTEPRGHAVFTPNPEMLVLARHRPLFRSALNSADLAIPDGVGLLWAARLLGKKLAERVTGTDMVDRVCELATQRGVAVFLLGGGRGVAERAASELVKKYPKLKVVGAATGGDVVKDEQGVPVLTSSVQEMLLAAKPTILFVAFGHGKQEEWIQAHLHEFPFIRVAMGIGGAFDFIAGDVKRAPGWLRKVRLEWLWRLVLQPRRIKRILTAVIVFPCLVIGERLGIIRTE